MLLEEKERQEELLESVAADNSRLVEQQRKDRQLLNDTFQQLNQLEKALQDTQLFQTSTQVISSRSLR